MIIKNLYNYTNRGVFELNSIDINLLFKNRDTGEYGIITDKDGTGNITGFFTLEVRSFINNRNNGGAVQRKTDVINGRISQRYGSIKNNLITWSAWFDIMNNSDMAARDNRMNNMDADRNNVRNLSSDAYNRTTDLYNQRNAVEAQRVEATNRSNHAYNVAIDANHNRVSSVRLSAYLNSVNLSSEQYHQGRHGAYVITALNTGRPDYGDMRMVQIYRPANGWVNTFYS